MKPSSSRLNTGITDKGLADKTINTGRDRKGMLINQGIFSLGHFIIDVYMNLLPPIMPLISKDMGLSLALAATVLSAKTISSSFLQPYFGYLIDRKQNKWLLPLSIAWVSVTMGLVGVVDNYYLLLILSALSGIGSAIYHPLGSTYSNIFAEDNKGLAVSIFSTGGNLGVSVGPAVVMPVVLYFGLKGTALFMLPGLAIAVLFILYNIYYLKAGIRLTTGAEAPLSVGAEAPLNAGLETPAKLSSSEVGPQPGARPDAAAEKEERGSLRTGVVDKGEETGSVKGSRLFKIRKLEHRSIAVIILSIIVTLRSVVHAGMGSFLPYYFLDMGYSDLVSSRLLSLFLLCGAVTGIFGGYISDRYGRKIVTVVSMIATAVLLLVFLNTSGILSLVVLILTGGMLLLSLPVTIIYAQEIIPESKGFASGLMMGLCYGIAGLTITPLGAIADAWGLKWVMGLFVIVLIAGALLFLTISRLTGNNYAG